MDPASPLMKSVTVVSKPLSFSSEAQSTRTYNFRLQFAIYCVNIHLECPANQVKLQLECVRGVYL